MFITIGEIIDIILMSLFLGFIFSDMFKKPAVIKDITDYYKQKKSFFDWESIKIAIIISAPAIVLHELSHKFVAMAFGATATLHAAYSWYIIILFLKLIRFPLMFFVGGYVTHTPLPPLQSSAVAFAGPCVNLVLWIGSILVLKFVKLKKTQLFLVAMTKQLNMFLFIFNMIPLPGFDGYGVFSGIIGLLLGK
ncbi:MAG: M50 family metallopeptidase [archaeon]